MTSKQIKVVRAETLLKNRDEAYDPAMVRLEVAKRHSTPGGYSSYPSGAVKARGRTFDQETEIFLAKALAAVR